MVTTRVTELLGITHPIIQGGMQWVATAPLAAAVSEAGGLGIISALTQPTAGDLTREIDKARKLTDRPLGVNLTILPSINPPPYADYAQAIVHAGVGIVETAGANPRELLPFFKEHGVTVIHKCTSVRHALSAQAAGVDAISIDGFEAAGHPGEDDIPGLVLIRKAAQSLDLPVIATGGFADGQGLVAALALGAEAIAMGTRFLCTVESPIHDDIKRSIVEASELDTELIFRPLRNTSRVSSNAVSRQVVGVLDAGGTFEDVREIVAGARGRLVYETGDKDAGIWTVGLSQGLIQDIPTVRDLIDRIMGAAQDCVDGRLLRMFESPVPAQ
jgi:NADH:quinone reductase (non-electrogenic)